MRKAFTTSLLAGSLLLDAAMAHAQATFRLGPKVGYNLSSCRIALPDLPDPLSMSTSYRSGAEAGLVAQARVSDRLVVQPAVLYAQKGYGFARQNHNASFTHREEHAYRLDYLSVPVNLVYSQRPAGRGRRCLPARTRAICSAAWSLPLSATVMGPALRAAGQSVARWWTANDTPIPPTGSSTPGDPTWASRRG
ncbi:outer membrane beta-barrel protein [Hymenobacter humi]|uniref:Outer membrane beta-barrel protein n=1 Tax=Hymenobacter humi TaxID=1411620 RepID=A0ABW2UBC0_9BACT